MEYENKGQEIVVSDGTVINVRPSAPTYVTSNIAGAATSIDDTDDNTTHDYTVEFAEKYQPDLELDDDTDAFGRPSHTWTWKNDEIGTYVDYDKLVAEYTTKVTGRDLYDALGSSAIDRCNVMVYIDGVDDHRQNPAVFSEANMIRSNTEAVGDTGNGVLTQVFHDTEEDEITVAIINTYLAIATDDYDEDDEVLDVDVYAFSDNFDRKDDAVVSGMEADNEDVDVSAYVEDDIMLVRIADGVIKEVLEPEIISDATVTAYSLTKHTVTTGGTTYDKADTRLYDQGILDDQYTTPENLKDLTYNIILDPYGYFIGLERNEDPDQYVFITGYEEYTKNLTTAVAEAGAIFVDGTMENIDVKVKSSMGWDPDGNPVENSWYTYSVNSSEEYTLTPVVTADDDDPFVGNVDVAQFAWSYTDDTKDIDKAHISLPAWAENAGVTQGTVNNNDVAKVVYGNADTVYISVDTEFLTNTSAPAVADRGSPWASSDDGMALIIDDVVSVTTGVKNANITVAQYEFGGNNVENDPDLTAAQGHDSARANASAGVYTLYNDDGYIIASIVVGEDAAASTNYVFALGSDANLETYSSEEDEHTWTRPVIVNGEEKELVYKGDAIEYIGRADMVEGNIYKVSYNADGEVMDSDLIVDITLGVNAITAAASLPALRSWTTSLMSRATTTWSCWLRI